MKKATIIILLLTILVACKKNSNVVVTEPIPAVVIPKIKTITTPTNVATHTYDAQGRLILLTNTSNNSKYEYTYANNTVTSNYYIGATLNTTKVLDLNTDGLAIRETYTFPVINIPYKTNYTYNANKQRVAVIYSNTLNTDVTTYTNFYTGNTLDSAHTTNSTNNDITRSYYTYYTDKISTTKSNNRGSLFVGQEATMPIKKITNQNFFGGVSTTQTSDYTYIFDTQNRITQSSGVASSGGGTIVTQNFTYYD